MKTKTSTILSLVLFFLFCTSISLKAQKDKSKRLEVFSQKKTQKIKKAASPEAKLANVVHPGKSANYFWDNQSNQWVSNDSSIYVYNSFSWLISETKMLNSTPLSRTTFSYDNQGRVTEELYQNWNTMNNTWDNLTRVASVFDNNGNQIEYRYDTYSTQWDIQFGYKNLYTYDAQNRVTENIYQNYSNNNFTWENDWRETAFVHNGNNVAQFEEQSWNGSGWDNEAKTVLVYGLNSMPVQVDFMFWNNNTYENDMRYTNLTFHNWCGLYCEQSALISGTLQIWNGAQWNTEERINSIYDMYGGYVQTAQTYTNSVWVNDYRDSEMYDNYFNYTGYRSESWNVSNSTWEIDYESKEIHSYNANNQLTQTIWQYWNGAQLENSMKKEYFDFQTFTAVNELKNDIRLSIYPNPCMGECFIEYTNSGNLDADDLTLRLIDVYGKEVYSTPLKEARIKIETNTLPSGVYFYQLNSANQSLKTGKLIVE